MRNSRIVVALVAGGIGLVTATLNAQSAGAPYQDYVQAVQPNHYQGTSGFRASQIIGQPVRSASGEVLGKVEDLVVNLQADSVPCAIIEYGGAFGVIGQTKVAVPLQDLRWSNRTRELTVNATKQQFETASSAPTGRWVAVQEQGGLQNVNRFFGQPGSAVQSQYEQQEMPGTYQGREPVRNPSDQVATPNQPIYSTTSPAANDQLAAQVNAVVQQDVESGSRNIQTVIKNGVVTLQGRIPTQEQKDLLEKQIKALPGVDRVQDNLITGPQ